MTVEKSYFKKATKSLTKAKIAITGPSGAGKTLGALYIAKGLGGKTAVIDSENNSASLYEDLFPDWEYFVLPISPPFTAQRYLWCIEQAIKEGFENIIIDSYTHVWDGEGGLKQQKDALDSRGKGNTFTNWGPITKLFEQLKGRIQHTNVHIICTMRSKQAYVLSDADGKQVPKKVGLAPMMREGVEYEFTVVFDVGMDHQFVASKDRTNLFRGVVGHLNEDIGVQIKEWLAKPKAPAPPPPPKQEPPQEHPPIESQTVPEPEHESQEPPQLEPPIGADPGEYLFTYATHKNKRLRELNEIELKNLVENIRSKLRQKTPPSNVAELFEIQAQAAAFLSSNGVEI